MEKKFDHHSAQQAAQNLWKTDNTYSFDPSSDKPIYSIDTPPPTVSGQLHIGHVFSYTHTDLIARFKRMTGHNVFYPMGFDDNGLPTERYVEKQNKLKAHQLKRSEFIELCLKTSHEVEQLFENLWRQMALSVDWSRTYSTISDKARKISQYSFVELYKKDKIFRKEEPALYCTTCRTSVAQAELDNIDKPSTFNTIRFSTQGGKDLLIATTRPELLPACVAVFYHPDDSRYNILAGQMATTPIYGKQVPLLPDDSVDPEKGTGIVMCCTFGDQTDIHWFKTHKLPFLQVVGNDGKWTEQTGELAGLNVQQARKKIIELLKTAGLLVEQKKIVHAVSVHERCKQEIEYLILRQWFVKILQHKQEFLDLAEQVEWTPRFMKSRYRDWVENLAWDWCISRQRFFGIPFPVWHCNSCDEILLAKLEDLPIDPQETTYPGGACSSCKSTDIRPETDVMDTWNTSSLTPQINCNWPESSGQPSIPMSMRPQAHDIIRTWAFYTIIKSYYHNGTLPWKQTVISGHVLAGKEKISKSADNSKMNPETLLATYPVDAIRYWTANAKPGMDLAFSEQQIRIGQRLVTKLWNAFRFCKQHIEQHDPSIKNTNIDTSLNLWIKSHFAKMLQRYLQSFKNYDYHIALESAQHFFWNHFCDNYIELVKDQFFNPDKYDADTIRSTQATLYEIGFGILQIFSPVLPYVTETLYQELYREKVGTVSLANTQYISNQFEIDEHSIAIIDAMVRLVGNIRKLKSEHKLSLNADVAHLHVHCDDAEMIEKLEKISLVICGVTKAQTITFEQQPLPESSLTTENEKHIIRVHCSS